MGDRKISASLLYSGLLAFAQSHEQLPGTLRRSTKDKARLC